MLELGMDPGRICRVFSGRQKSVEFKFMGMKL